MNPKNLRSQLPLNKATLIFAFGIVVGIIGTLLTSRHETIGSPNGNLKSTLSDNRKSGTETETTVNSTRRPKENKETARGPNEPSIFTEETDWNAPVTIPQSLAYKITPLSTSFSGLEISPLSLIGYGLTKEQTDKMVGFINSMAQEISDLEAANSTLIRNPNGDEYYEIKSFKEKGNEIKTKIRDFIDTTFAEYKDDRALLFKKQLHASSIFDDYGETTRQISLAETQNASGGVDLSFSLVRLKDGVEIANSTNSLQTHKLENRYRKVVEKNK